MDWTEKYRPKTLDDVIGNPAAVTALRSWAKQWNEGKPSVKVAVLSGSPGVGKTTSAEALAREMGWGIVEMNASDSRTAGDIERIAIRGARSDSFDDDGMFLRSSEGGRKLIVLDEADNFFGNSDRGASTAVNSLMKLTSQPVMLIVNDLYGLTKKIPAVKTGTLQIAFKKPMARSIAKALGNIAAAEGVEVDPDTLLVIAENASGDMRAAVRNLESLALGQDRVTMDMAEDLSLRDDRSDVYKLIGAIFRGSDPVKARLTAFDTDLEPRDIVSWVDEALPTECKDNGDLVRGFEALSSADIFLRRVTSRQYYGFWSYATDMSTFGICASRYNRTRSDSRINYPGIATKMKASKKARAVRDSVCLKLAEHLHTTSHRVCMDVLQYVRVMMANDAELRIPLTESMDLDSDELGFLIGKKADSKAVSDVYDAIDAMKDERIRDGPSRPIESQDLHSIDISFIRPAATVAAEPAAEPPKKQSGQRSLFDF